MDDQPPPSYSATARAFQNSFHVYRTRHNSADLYLGHAENECFRAISCYHGYNWTKTGVYLHEGPTADTSVIAFAGADGRLLSSRSKVTVASPPAPVPVSEEFKTYTYKSTTQAYQFRLIVPGGDEKLPATFEWRQLHSKDLAENVHDMQLLWLEDQGQIVATAHKTSNLATKLGTFTFRGAAVGGGLGPAFSAAVVVTALRVWQTRYLLEDQQRDITTGAL